MHPILSQTRRLGFYLLAWVPLAGFIIYPVLIRSGLRSVEGGILAGTLVLIYAFACLSSWYTARSTPIATSSFVRLAGTHFFAGGLVSGLWVIVAIAFTYFLSAVGAFPGIFDRLRPGLSTLWGMGVLLYVISTAMHYVLLAMENSAQAEQRAIQARVLARDAELRALKAQVNPHFLFNSLHSISALTSVDPSKAREMCLALSEFLRMTLGLGERTTISLTDELSLLRSYLAVEKIRFGARLNMTEEIAGDTLNCLVPPLLLQPLIENAVGHGIANLPEGGWIRLSIMESPKDNLLIDVQNNYDPDAPPRRKNGMGLRNVRNRLEARFGKQSQVTVNKDDNRFEVMLSFPAERTSTQ